MLPNVSVAPNRNKLPHYVHLDGTGCTQLLALYWLMVFVHEAHVLPSSAKVKTKRHLFSYLVLAGSEYCLMCKLLQTQKNYHITYIWMVLVAPFFYHYIDWWCLFMKHMCCHLVAKWKLKGLFSCLFLASSECCPMCQLLQTGTNYHITSFGWYRLHPFSGIILIDGVYTWNKCDAK